MTSDEKTRMKQKLESLEIPFHDVKVFGAIRCNIHVRCVSVETAKKWVHALGLISKLAKINTVKTAWPAIENKFTASKPTMRQGFLIVAIF